MKSFFVGAGVLVFSAVLSCTVNLDSTVDTPEDKEVHEKKIYTVLSDSSDEYVDFNSTAAINRVAELENEYFNNLPKKGSKYYGTTWSDYAVSDYSINDSVSVWELYKDSIGVKPDSMHCTIYAVEALKFGMEDAFDELQLKHEKVWKDREHAGWSIGHLLVKHFNWKAYLFISPESNEYSICKNNFKKAKFYRVWKQPFIKLEGLYDLTQNQNEIDSILSENEFGWGFSDQGWHTWITRYDTLKECNWSGAPMKSLNLWNADPLFKKTKFLDYKEYTSHVVIFPPKKK